LTVLVVGSTRILGSKIVAAVIDKGTVEVIATAKAVKSLCEAQLPLHLSDSRIELVVYEFDFLTMTNIAQFC
jgi:hypothetical protein